ncbi:MAG: hypothetical protein Q4D19_13255 [Lautropia sp.]|nr:hypothetical protein [Lautropia sp.]
MLDLLIALGTVVAGFFLGILALPFLVLVMSFVLSAFAAIILLSLTSANESDLPPAGKHPANPTLAAKLPA